MGKKAAKRKIKWEPKQKPTDDSVLREIIIGIADERGYGVARAFMGNERTAEEVAKRLDIQVNLVRKILYSLYEGRVASYRRARDEESGWYVYYWRIDPERALEYFNKNKRQLIQKLEERLKVERSTDFFSCGDGDPKLPFDLAAENDFRCPRCGGKMEPYDNAGVVTALEYRIESLRHQLIQNKR